MKIEKYEKYKVKLNYHRMDDLRDGVTPNGETTIVEAVWVAEDDEQFAGEQIFIDGKTGYHLPMRDIIILEKSTSEEYYNLAMGRIKTSQPIIFDVNNTYVELPKDK